MSDYEFVNKENATPTMSPVLKQSTPEMRIRVGGVTFILDQDTLQKLNSQFLYQRLGMKDPDGSPKSSLYIQGGLCKTSSQDDAGVAVVDEANAECFSSFLHMARFGTLPTSVFSKNKRELLLHQADTIWGIRAQVEEALDKARKDFCKCCNVADAVNKCLMMDDSMPPNDRQRDFHPVSIPPSKKSGSSYSCVPAGASAVSLCGPHHNFRRDDGSRRVFCSSCGHRDIDWRYHVGDFYSNCQTCQKEIHYKPDLGWCHKCRQCTDCQTTECPGVPIKQLNEQVIPFVIASLKENESALSFF